MKRLFDPKMYEEYAARHKLERPNCCLLHAEISDLEGDSVLIGDAYVIEHVLATYVAKISKVSGQDLARITMRINHEARNIIKESEDFL